MGLELARTLSTAPLDRISGTLLVAGDPGGSFHFRDGAIVEVVSPGAPGAETLLLRSGRVGDADWASVTRFCATERRPVAGELVARAWVGAAELQLICVAAALDGALAVGMGRIDGFRLERETPDGRLTALQAIEPEWLVREAERRIRALASRRRPFSPFRTRLGRTDAGTASLDTTAPGERREILLRANGRRSARDIAFLLGRSLYAVAVEVSRLLEEGLLDAVAPARPQDAPARPVRPAPPEGGLPRRLPGASGITDVLPLRPAAGL
ncbi:MarR family transcriptional regulator [Streptomyces sp. WAC06614]|uniref:MarR family transcriptional regulator n=1 Tax=Streptomyces sp. WAC06614 TaxID=2487416 RepID=UPI000F7829CD|nr:MarR family transcriptional regulator [Streptomyces sp. WAC06614]RSS76690.1 MarR family transcriptional regulator [Streptomyces sp. WAC06614]